MIIPYLLLRPNIEHNDIEQIIIESIDAMNFYFHWSDVSKPTFLSFGKSIIILGACSRSTGASDYEVGIREEGEEE